MARVQLFSDFLLGCLLVINLNILLQLQEPASENQSSSLRSRFTKFEKDLTQVSKESQTSLLQSKLAKTEQELEQASKAKEQSSQLSVPGETALDYTSDFSRLRKVDKGKDESFSACLMLMDDNHRLSEWIAYHYFAMPLRHLVVNVDPRSRTSPAKILDRWRPLMNITVWGGAGVAEALNETDSLAKTKMHLQRQMYFYSGCARYLQKENRTWTTFHDVDEFLTVDEHFVNDTETLLKEPGNVLQTLRNVRSTQPHNTHFQKICITVPRVMYGSIESSTEQVQKDVPSFLDGMKFDTLRYRHRGEHGTGENVKSILDVTYAKPRKKYEIHQLIGNRHCSYKYTPHNILGIHHYLGSWESYSYRDDARRGKEHSRQRFDERANVRDVMNDDEVRPWIKVFVDFVGEPLARHLLQDVGEFDDNNGYITAT
jgi:hypothetical protein